MSKIAIVTLYDNINIGNKLQNYAVERLASQYGTVQTLTYKEAHDIVPLISMKHRISALLGIPKSSAPLRRKIIERRKKFVDFSKKYLHAEKENTFLQHILNDNTRFNAFIVGSDQVWHNWTETQEELQYFLLSFVPSSKRICLAPSFGYTEIPERDQDIFKRELPKFRYLSCRERSGVNIIESLTSRKDVELIMDPTLSIEREEWKSIEKKPNFSIPPKYILVYFIGGISEQAEVEIKELAQKNDAALLNIFDERELQYYSTSPDEFVYLIHHAFAVCTNSFHGCVFSLIFHRNFKLFTRIDNEGSKMSSRQDGLLKYFSLTEPNMPNYDFSWNIDYSNTDHLISDIKSKTQKYLSLCFSDIEK